MPPALLKPWIDRLQASGRYSFLRSEAVHDSGLTPNAVVMLSELGEHKNDDGAYKAAAIVSLDEFGIRWQK